MKKERIAMLLAGAGMLAAGLLQPARAAQTGDSMSVNFRGEFVIATSCTISNDHLINVAFGEVVISEVNGSNYSQPVPYTVDCKGAADSTPLNLTMSGTATGFDSAAVATSANGLGIQILANNRPMTLNTPKSTTLAGISSLTLTAVPVKDPAKTLTEGTFSATATLTASYQ